MNKHSIALAATGFTSIACVSAAYLMNRNWLIVPALLVMVCIWLIGKKHSIFWSATSMLGAYVLLAAIGVQAGLHTPLIVIGCAAALVSWDIIIFIDTFDDGLERTQYGNVGELHFRSLGFAVIAGIAMPLSASLIELQLSFGLTVGLVLVAAGSFVFAVHTILRH